MQDPRNMTNAMLLERLRDLSVKMWNNDLDMIAIRRGKAELNRQVDELKRELLHRMSGIAADDPDFFNKVNPDHQQLLDEALITRSGWPKKKIFGTIEEARISCSS